jgi:hypothetical protein
MVGRSSVLSALIAERDAHRVLRFTAVLDCANSDGPLVVVGYAVPVM